jgi:oligopeptide transport system permease protein
VPAYVVKRLLSALPTLFVIITLSFFLMRLAPGGPFDLERPLDAKVLENLRRIYQLDQPIWRQYLSYLQALAQGDLGPSFSSRDFSVNELFAKALPVSMRLGSTALVLALALGAALGAWAAMRQNSKVDYLVTAVAALGITIPTFVVAPILQLVFGLWLGWLPVGGWEEGRWSSRVLPIATLALPQIAVIARLTRAAMIEVLRSHHVRTLRSQGLPLSIMLKHTLRAAALPVVSYLGPAAAALMTGSIVVESVFGLPGVGRYFVEGALNRDYTLVMGTVVVVAMLVVFFNLIVDLVYAWLDPRVRYD